MSHRILAIQGEVNLQSLYYSKVLYKKYRKHIKSLKESLTKSKLMRMPAECEDFNVIFDVKDFTFSVQVSETSFIKIPTQITEIDLYKSQLRETIEKANSLLDNEKYSLNNALFTEVKTINKEIESNLVTNELDFSKFNSMFNSDRDSIVDKNINEIKEIKNILNPSNAHNNIKAVAETALKHFTISSALIASGAPVSRENMILYAAIFGVGYVAKKIKNKDFLSLAKKFPKTIKAASFPAEAGERVYKFIQSNKNVSETFLSLMKTLRAATFKIPFIGKKDNLASFIADAFVDSNNLTANISGRNRIDLSSVKFKDVLEKSDLVRILKRLGYDIEEGNIDDNVVKSFIQNPTLSSLFFNLISSRNMPTKIKKKPSERNKKDLEKKYQAEIEQIIAKGAFKAGKNLYIHRESRHFPFNDFLKSSKSLEALVNAYDFNVNETLQIARRGEGWSDELWNEILSLTTHSNKDETIGVTITINRSNNKPIINYFKREEDKLKGFDNKTVDIQVSQIITGIGVYDFVKIPDYFNSEGFEPKVSEDSYKNLSDELISILVTQGRRAASEDDSVENGPDRTAESDLKKYTKSYIESLKVLQDSISGKGSFYHALDYLLEKSPSTELGVDQILSSLLIESFDVYGFEGMSELIDGTAQSLGFINNLTQLMNDNSAIQRIVSGKKIDLQALAKEIFKQTSKNYFIDSGIDLNTLANDLFNSNSNVSDVIETFVESLYNSGNRNPVTKLGKDLETNIFDYLKKLIPEDQNFDSDAEFFDFIKNQAATSQDLNKLLDSQGFWKNVGFNFERGLMTTCFEKTFGKVALNRVKQIYDTVESNQHYAMHSALFRDQTTNISGIGKLVRGIKKKTGPVLGSLLIMSQLFGTGAAVVVGGAELHKETKAEVVADIKSDAASLEAQTSDIQISKVAIKGSDKYVKVPVESFIKTLTLYEDDSIKDIIKSLEELAVGSEMDDEERKAVFIKFTELCYSILTNDDIDDIETRNKALSLFDVRENFDEFLLVMNLIEASSANDEAYKEKSKQILFAFYKEFHTRLLSTIKSNPDKFKGDQYYTAIFNGLKEFIAKNDGNIDRGIDDYTKYCMEHSDTATGLHNTLNAAIKQNNEILSLLKFAITEARDLIQKDIERLEAASNGEEIPDRRDIADEGTIQYQARLLNHLNRVEGKEDSIPLQAYNITNLETIFGESTEDPLERLYGYSEIDAAYLDKVYQESEWLSSIMDRIGIVFKKNIKTALQRSISVQIIGGKLARDIVFSFLEDEVELNAADEAYNILTQDFHSHAVDSFYGNYFVTILSFFLTSLFGLFISRNRVFSKIQLIKFMSNAVNFGTAHYESILIRKFLVASAENSANCALAIGNNIRGGNPKRIVDRNITNLEKCLKKLENVVIAKDDSLSISDVIDNIRTGQRKKKSAT